MENNEYEKSYLLNNDRSKKKINIINKDFKNEIINYIDEFGVFKLFTLERIKPYDNKFIKTELIFKNKSTQFDYMDDDVRDICSKIAKDLRDELNKNMYFDLVSGNFYFYT